jgi:cell division protein FtsB
VPVLRATLRSRFAQQAALLGAVLAIIAALVAVPLRSYVAQKQALSDQLAQENAVRAQLADLQQQEAALQDPDHIKAEARARLQYVMPGDTVYVVQVPDEKLPGGNAPAAPTQTGPWYSDLWDTLSDPPAPTTAPKPATTPAKTTAPAAPASGRASAPVPAKPSTGAVATSSR